MLLTPGNPLVKFDVELESLVQDMFDTMYDAEGVGLAAQQIDVPLRLFVMDCDGIKLVAANPEIISVDGEQNGEEGCLSVGKIRTWRTPTEASASMTGCGRCPSSSGPHEPT